MSWVRKKNGSQNSFSSAPTPAINNERSLTVLTMVTNEGCAIICGMVLMTNDVGVSLLKLLLICLVTSCLKCFYSIRNLK